MSSETENLVESAFEELNEWIRIVAILIQLTEEGKLKWKSAFAPESLKREPDSKVEAVYFTEYKNKKIRLYAEIIKVDDLNPLFNIGLFKKKYPYYEREIVMQVGDKSAHGWYTVPDVGQDILESLLESVKYNVLGIDDFLDDALQSDTEPAK